VSTPARVVPPPPWDDAAFEAELRGAEKGYWDRHPFHRRMAVGELRPEELRAWVANRWYYQDAALFAACAGSPPSSPQPGQ
jgi:pyrroloquinoline-quinone synthase